MDQNQQAITAATLAAYLDCAAMLRDLARCARPEFIPTATAQGTNPAMTDFAADIMETCFNSAAEAIEQKMATLSRLSGVMSGHTR